MGKHETFLNRAVLISNLRFRKMISPAVKRMLELELGKAGGRERLGRWQEREWRRGLKRSVLQKLSPEYLRHPKALCGGLFLNRCPTPPQFPAAAPVHIICSDESNSMSQTWGTAAFEVGSSAPNLRWRLACERLTRVCPSGPHLWCNESGQAGQRKDLNCHPLTAKAPIGPTGTALQPRWSFGDAWLCSEVTGPLRLTLRSVLGCELSSGRTVTLDIEMIFCSGQYSERIS